MEETELKRIWILFSISFFIFLAGCQKPAATVNGENITKEELKKAIAQRSYANSSKGVVLDQNMLKNSVLQELIDQKLLLQEARKKQITVTDNEVEQEFNAVLLRAGREQMDYALKATNTKEADLKNVIRTTLAINKLLALSAVPISDSDASKFYNDHKGSFKRPESVKIRLIQVSSGENAETIAKEIKGSSFDPVADRLEKEGKAIVSPASWVPVSALDQDINNALKSLKPGASSGSVRVKGGFYIVKLYEKQPEKILSFDETKEQIKMEIQRTRAGQIQAELIASLRSQAKIKISL